MTPTTEQELSEIIAGSNGPLRIRGSGTRAIGRTDGADLSLASMTGITLYEPGAMTIVAKAGTPVAEIEETLAKENQRLAFEPMDHRTVLGTQGEPTIGGVVAANVSGPRRIAVGACRDFALGVRFVDGSGTVIKNGGRVMKNVTGYDLVKLLAGSYGTLGVLTEVSLKVLPEVETSATLTLRGLDDKTAIRALSSVLGSPFEVTGAAHLAGTTMIRIEGFEASVAYRAGKLRDLLRSFGEATVEDADWTAIRDVRGLADQPGDIWRISTTPSAAADLVAQIDPKAVQYDWGGGLIWALTPEGTDLRTKLGAFDGHATLIRGKAAQTFHPEPAPLAAISQGLRAKFDPRGILNPGLMT
ncbi:FAD-binding protein [Yoonia sp. 2307UL14-13]|uniref:FAD-binding protein n=1 Tax=Yoonia sp. 2307UL14-13 TaxID=3126506 RepID=UPI0030AE824A